MKPQAEIGQTIQTIHQGENLSPRNHMAATQICCEPWTTYAHRIHTSVAAPASSPKLRPKRAKPAAEAMAYYQVAAEEKNVMHGGQAAVNVRKPDNEEEDTNEEPGERKDPGRRLETEE